MGLEDGKIQIKLSNGKPVAAPLEMFAAADWEAALRFAVLGVWDGDPARRNH